MKKRSYIIMILVIIGIVSVFIFWKIMASPQYSLKQLKKATPEHNVTAFYKYVNLDEVIDHMIVQTWQYYTSREEPGSRWNEIRREISSSLLSVVKPNLKEIIKKKVLDYVTTGQWTGIEEEDEDKISSLLIRVIKERIDPEQWEHQSINFTEIEGEIAHIGLTYYDQMYETNFLVEIKMRDMKGYWQMIEITNLAQLLSIFHNIDSL